MSKFQRIKTKPKEPILKDFIGLKVENYIVKKQFLGAYRQYIKRFIVPKVHENQKLKEFAAGLPIYYISTDYFIEAYIDRDILAGKDPIIEKAQVTDLISLGFPKSDFLHLLNN